MYIYFLRYENEIFKLVPVESKNFSREDVTRYSVNGYRKTEYLKLVASDSSGRLPSPVYFTGVKSCSG
ncbi:hypothetical protein V1477_008546 [Vespula maculifrons]|uniref:Uncharacterized protein n=1 Tax=Vespula maculifrons TaxID=7453 RepID=A0ABD2CDC2_VESMC